MAQIQSPDAALTLYVCVCSFIETIVPACSFKIICLSLLEWVKMGLEMPIKDFHKKFIQVLFQTLSYLQLLFFAFLFCHCIVLGTLLVTNNSDTWCGYNITYFKDVKGVSFVSRYMPENRTHLLCFNVAYYIVNMFLFYFHIWLRGLQTENLFIWFCFGILWSVMLFENDALLKKDKYQNVFVGSDSPWSLY